MRSRRSSRCPCRRSCCTCPAGACRSSAWASSRCSCSRRSRTCPRSTTVRYLSTPPHPGFFPPSFMFAYAYFFGDYVVRRRRRRRRRIMPLSLCAVCAWPVIVARRQVAVHPSAAEACVPGLQRPHARARSLEVSVHGLTPNGHWRLAGVRDAWARPRDFAVLDGTVLYSNVISPLHGHREVSLSSYATLIMHSIRLP